jgi:uncharacterized protein (DUF488 family)
MPASLYTIGYEGTSLQAFVHTLKAHGVETVADVRELPLSRKRGFSKTALSEELASQGLWYVHLRALGCPREIRRDYRADGDWARYTRRYLAYLETQNEAVQSLARLAQQGNCALVCFEANAARCHRSYVAEATAKHLGPSAKAVHLVPDSTRP